MRSRLSPKGNLFAQDLAAGVEALRMAGNPEALAHKAGLVPDPWQLRVLRSVAAVLLICCTRQAGKSTIVAMLIVAEMLLPGRTVVIVAPSERQSKELYRKVLTFWRRLGRPIGHLVVNRTSLELVNESRLLALPGNADTIRGVSAVNLLVADEASVIPDELFDAVAPMLAVSGGRTVACSTPKGRRGWWYDLWQMGDPQAADYDPGIELVRVTAPEIPRISADFLAREKRRRGTMIFLQEYMCEFLDDERQAFSTEDIEASQVEGMDVWAWALEENEVA